MGARPLPNGRYALVAAQSGDFDLGAFALVLLFTALVMLFIGRVVYRDVEKRNGEGAKIVVAFVLFWPLGLYRWMKTRREFAVAQSPQSSLDRVRTLETRVAELAAELRGREGD